MTKDEINVNLEQFDKRINQLEEMLTWVQDQRREFINRHDLNKPCPSMLFNTSDQSTGEIEREDKNLTFSQAIDIASLSGGEIDTVSTLKLGQTCNFGGIVIERVR